MYIVNFSHPLTPENLAEVRRCLPALPADETITVVDIPTDIDRSLPIREEARRLIAAVPWREMGDEETYLINPPGLAILALAIQVAINAEYTESPISSDAVDTCIAIRAGEHYYTLHADGRVISEQAEADLTFEDISLMSQAMQITLPGQGYPSAEEAMVAGMSVRNLHRSGSLDCDDVFDLDEAIRLRHALRQCPSVLREQAMDRLREWRIRESLLQTLLDGLTEIHGVDSDGDPILGLTGAGRSHAKGLLA